MGDAKMQGAERDAQLQWLFRWVVSCQCGCLSLCHLLLSFENVLRKVLRLTVSVEDVWIGNRSNAVALNCCSTTSMQVVFCVLQLLRGFGQPSIRKDSQLVSFLDDAYSLLDFLDSFGPGLLG